MSHPIEQLQAIMAQLRDPDHGCPWDQKQTFESIVPHTIEETYEVVDAIHNQDWDNLREELGDFVFQAIFYSQLAKEKGWFDFETVIQEVNDKLIRRHPHVFGDEKLVSEAEVHDRWEKIKALEKSAKQTTSNTEESGLFQSVLSNVPHALPAFNKAYKLQARAAKFGFDWDTLPPVVAKVHEELDEVLAELAPEKIDHSKLEGEVGDLLFAVVNLARHLKVNPETALARTNHKFTQRFQGMEALLHEQGASLTDCSLETLDQLWEAVKSQE